MNWNIVLLSITMTEVVVLFGVLSYGFSMVLRPRLYVSTMALVAALIISSVVTGYLVL